MFRARSYWQIVLGLGLTAFLATLAGCGGSRDAKKEGGRMKWGAAAAASGTRASAACATMAALTGQAESYERIFENDFLGVAHAPLSTFSIDVDTASYSNVRRFLLDDKQLPPKDAVRIEEFINYFQYDYAAPKDGPIAVSAETAGCPWNARHRLVRIGLQGKTMVPEDMPPRNLVFLVDTSGSMDAPNRLPLLQHALGLLVAQLTERDRVAIVAYAGQAGLVLPSTPGDRHGQIMGAIQSLSAGGSTNGGEGIVLAYRIAVDNFIKGGANRVILGTDGDFNVGVTSQAELVRLIEDKRSTGVYLSVLGFGMGNLKDPTMQKLAQHGNGQYAYIDSVAEARKVFVQDLANLVPIARDVKIQVEFNPALVQAYRLIGYENRLLKNQDFNDDTRDAGDMGAGHSVTALYEIVPTGVAINLPNVDPLRYQKTPVAAPPGADGPAADELLTVKVRYIPPEGKQSLLLSVPLRKNGQSFAEASTDFRFTASVAAFGMLLRDSRHKGTATFAQVQDIAKEAQGPDLRGHRAEFLRLVRIAANLAKGAAGNKE